MNGDHSRTSRGRRRRASTSENATRPSRSHTSRRSFAVGIPAAATITTDPATNSAGPPTLTHPRRTRTRVDATRVHRLRVLGAGTTTPMAPVLILALVLIVLGLI